MVMAHPQLLAGPFIFSPTMTPLSWMFKRWPAAGGGASCSCGNLCVGTMERAMFS